MTFDCSSAGPKGSIAGVDQAETVVVALMTSFVVPDSCLWDERSALELSNLGSGVDVDLTGELRRECC